MCLTTKSGMTLTVATVCQTWKCRRCGPKRKQYAALRAEHGSTLLPWPEPLSLITLTYRMTGTQDLITAQSALKDFRRFAQLLRRRSASQFRWFRVPEVTRRGQIHWHVISGDLAGTRLDAERLVRDCWAIATRRDGKVINHVVDVSPTTAKTSAAYVAKYLLKSSLSFQTLEERGFARRWGTSRNWSKPKNIILRGTDEDRWVNTRWEHPSTAGQEVEVGRRHAALSHLVDRVGDNLVLAIQARQHKRALASKFQKILGERP